MAAAMPKKNIIYAENFEDFSKTMTPSPLPKEVDGRKQESSGQKKREKREDDFATYTSLHGVPHWLNNQYSSRLRRIVYFILWLISFCLLAFNLYGNISEYLKYETKVSMKLELNDTLKFPSITICPENIWKKSRIGGSPIFYDMMKNFYQSLRGKDFGYCLDPTVPDLFPNLTYFYWHLSHYSDQQMVRDLGLGVKELLLSCEFQMEKANCNQLWISHVSELFLCMTFNYANPVKTTNTSTIWFDSAYETKVVMYSRPRVL